MSPVDAQHWVRDVMEKTYPLGVFCDRTKRTAADLRWKRRCGSIPHKPSLDTALRPSLGVHSTDSGLAERSA